MNFKQLNQAIQEQFTKMCKTGKLFRVNISGNEIWDKYISGFTPEQNPVFRDPNSSTYNCNNDKSFIRRYGNVVAIDEDYNLMSIFDVEASGDFIDTIPQLSQYVKSFPVIDVFVESYKFLNQEVNWERVNKKQEIYQLGATIKLNKSYGCTFDNSKFREIHISETVLKDILRMLEESYVKETEFMEEINELV